MAKRSGDSAGCGARGVWVCEYVQYRVQSVGGAAAGAVCAGVGRWVGSGEFNTDLGRAEDQGGQCRLCSVSCRWRMPEEFTLLATDQTYQRRNYGGVSGRYSPSC